MKNLDPKEMTDDELMLDCMNFNKANRNIIPEDRIWIKARAIEINKRGLHSEKLPPHLQETNLCQSQQRLRKF